MARPGEWYRIDKENGAVQRVNSVAIVRAARCYFERPNDIIASLRFTTPFAIYSDGSQLTEDEARLADPEVARG